MKKISVFLCFIIMFRFWVTDVYSQKGTEENQLPGPFIGTWEPLITECSPESRTIGLSEQFFIVNTNDIIRYSYTLVDTLNPDGSVNMLIYDAKISCDGGESYLEASWTDTMSISIYYDNNILVLLPHKDPVVTPGEVSQPEAFVRVDRNPEYEFTPGTKAVFIVPDNLRGYSWVAMEQPDGEVPAKNPSGSIIINIPESGKMLSQAPTMPEALAKREFAFYFQSGSPIPPIHENCISLLRGKKLSDEGIIAHGYNPDQLYVSYSRYNNPGRREINKLFGRKITGQVFWFQVDTLRDMVKGRYMTDDL